MKPGFLLFSAGAVFLAGCGSSKTVQGTHPTATGKGVAVAPTSSTPTDPRTPGTPKPGQTVVAPPVTGDAYAKGRAYLTARDYASAKQQFELAVKKHLHTADAYAGVGTASLGQGKYVPAYRAYKSAIRLQPKNVGYLYYASYAALYAADYHGAIKYATQYIKIQPKNPDVYHLRFLAYGKVLDHRKQVKDARAELKLRPKSYDSYNDLGIALTNDNQFTVAIEAFTQAIKLRPKFPGSYINRALAENFATQPTLVLRDLHKARSLATDALTRKQIDQAIATFKKSSKH